MAKVKNPVTLSSYFGIARKQLDKLGVLDPTLALDTKLFIDPLLLDQSIHPEINTLAVSQYRKHFEMVISFLIVTNGNDDVAWRSARRLMLFPEVTGTCLGYGAASIHGSGFGPALTNKILNVGKQIIDLGIRNPDLFPAMALFESGIGPDRISDMTTNIILPALIEFNKRILTEVSLESEEFNVHGNNGKFLRNPFEMNRSPIILIPADILRTLPIANDWDSVADAANKNEILRGRVNEQITHIWAAKSKRRKDKLRTEVLSSESAFNTLLDIINDVPPKAYDTVSDPDGLINWAYIAKQFATQYPLILQMLQHPKNVDDIYDVVIQIINRFQQLIENNGLNKELYKESKEPRHESTAQHYFFAISYCYCEANNIDISPEVDSGTGNVDFKFSTGFNARVLVEVKLSANKKLAHGYETQLEVYKQSEQAMRAIYLVIDVGKMGKKDEKLIKIRNKATERGDPLSDLIFIDGTLKPSASKR